MLLSLRLTIIHYQFFISLWIRRARLNTSAAQVEQVFIRPLYSLSTKYLLIISLSEYSAKVEHPDRFELNSATAGIEQFDRKDCTLTAIK